MEDIAFEDFLFFVTFAESKNSIEAAKRLQVSQPTLTERLRAFEAKLPASPFAWAGKKKVLNPYGEQLLAAVKPKLTEMQGVLRDAIRLDVKAHSFKVMISARQEVLSRLMRNFEFDGQLQLDPTSSVGATQKVLLGQSDIALTRERVGSSEVVCHKLFVSQSALVFHKSKLGLNWNDLPSLRDKEAWRELVRKPYIGYGKNDLLLQDFLEATHLEFKDIDMKIVCENWMIVKELILKGKGYSIVPVEVIEGEKDFVYFPISLAQAPVSNFYLIYRKNFTKTEIGKKIIADIRKAFEK